MVPVDGLIDKPTGVDVKVPPGKPVIAGVGLEPELQYVDEVYVKDASSEVVMVTKLVVLAARQLPLAGIVLVIV